MVAVSSGNGDTLTVREKATLHEESMEGENDAWLSASTITQS